MQHNLEIQYSIQKHAHCFAAWAASRAASVKDCRLTVERGRHLIEYCKLYEFNEPDQLPEPNEIDSHHRQWRNQICERSQAVDHGMTKPIHLTHGIAAKLINIYLKSRFVCSGYHLHPRVAALHPPIDRLLLESLAKKNFGGAGDVWKKAYRAGWSKLESSEYEDLIGLIRKNLDSRPLWMIEEYWRGHQ